jgi:hypothetical protein
LWNDVANPTIQVVAAISRSPLARQAAQSDVELAQPTTPPERTARGNIIVEAKLASLQVVMVSKPLPEFEGWLKTTMDTAEVQLGRDGNAAATPNSPRKRRHNFSFAQEDHSGGFRSVTPAPSIVPIAELALSTVILSLEVRGVAGDSSAGAHLITGSLSVHEICVRDLVTDPMVRKTCIHGR